MSEIVLPTIISIMYNKYREIVANADLIYIFSLNKIEKTIISIVILINDLSRKFNLSVTNTETEHANIATNNEYALFDLRLSRLLAKTNIIILSIAPNKNSRTCISIATSLPRYVIRYFIQKHILSTSAKM